MKIDIEEIARLDLRAGDTLVIRMLQVMNPTHRENIRAHVEGACGHTGVKVLVLEGCSQIAVLTAPPAAA